MGDSLQLPLWREHYNPLRGLTIARIVAMEDAADRGQYADLQWLWRHMEPADVTVSAAIARRLAFLDTLSWQIRAIEGADPALAAEQTQFLTDAYNRIENLADATRFLALIPLRAVRVPAWAAESIANAFHPRPVRLSRAIRSAPIAQSAPLRDSIDTAKCAL